MCLSSWFHATPILTNPRWVSGGSSPSWPAYMTTAMSAPHALIIPSDSTSFHWWIPTAAESISWSLELGLRNFCLASLLNKRQTQKLQEIAIFYHVSWATEKVHLYAQRSRDEVRSESFLVSTWSSRPRLQ